MLLNSTLLRERFVIKRTDKQDAEPMVALGNRFLLALQNAHGDVVERFVIRAHSMHITLRVANAIMQEFQSGGPIANRQIAFKWDKMWHKITADFEHIHTPETWVSIYINGRSIFKTGEYHPFLDIIEQCDIKNRAEYDRAVLIAEDAFKQAGKEVLISHESTIGMVIGALEEKCRCGLILRAPKHTTTFNFQIEAHEEEKNKRLKPHIGLVLAADYLEGIQLSVSSGYVQSKIADGIVLTTDPEGQRSAMALKRIGRLNQSIQQFGQAYNVRYRPEKPDFIEILEEAKAIGQNLRI